MRITMVSRVIFILGVIASFVPVSPTHAEGGDRELNVMTINLLFSEVEDRDMRLNTIADFIKTCGETVDLILLQEVVGGALSKTINSALDLKNKLTAENLDYNLSYRMANGLPGLLTVGNAILSVHEIRYTLATTLPFESEEIFRGVEIPLRRKVMMSRIDVPGFGKINVYNTHLCAYCDPQERLEQTRVLMKFIKNVEALIPGSNSIILGGDFNIVDALIGTELAPEYELITSNGFTDSYAYYYACDNNRCCDARDSFATGCTFAVEDNPYAFNFFTGQPEETVRIDYIFLKNGPQVLDSKVVFNPNPDWVSDHSAVLTKIALP